MYSKADDRRRVAIPSDFFKIVLHERPDGFIDAIAVMLPNIPVKVPLDNTADYLQAHILSIDDIELRTGIRFLPNMDPTKEATVTAATAPDLWPVTIWPSSDLSALCRNFYPDL